jgi:metal-dependent amidase/aminoacylase/carboxypeptidase family protein
MPHFAGNPLSALCALVPVAEGISRRILEAGERGRIYFLSASSGTKSNVIPETAEAKVAITASADDGQAADRILLHLREELFREAQGMADVYRVQAEFIDGKSLIDK